MPRPPSSSLTLCRVRADGAVAGIFEAILDERDAIFSDALNHASIIDGIRLAKAQKLRYKHLDLADLGMASPSPCLCLSHCFAVQRRSSRRRRRG